MGVQSGSGDGLLKRLVYWFTGGSASGLVAPGYVRYGSDGELVPSGSITDPIYAVTDGAIQPTVLVPGQLLLDGTAQQLPSNVILDTITVWGKETNTGKLFIGKNSSLNTTDDGTGTGAGFLPGQGMSLKAGNSNEVFVRGTNGDIAYFLGS